MKTPIEEAKALASEFYIRPDVFEYEKRILRNNWISIANTQQLPVENSFFSFNLLDESVLLTKHGDKIRALSNVCRHRGACIKSGYGHAHKLICPYHGWTYSLEGKLLGCTEFDDVKNFNKEENGLPEFDVTVLDPFIFVNLNSNKPFKFEIPLELASSFWNDMQNLKFVERKTYNLNCNWKVFVDNYLDGGYHIKYAHPDLASAITYTEYTTQILDKLVVQETPLHNNKLRAGTAYYIWIWPNFMINLSDKIMDTNLVLPTGPETCQVIFDFYFDLSKLNIEYCHDSIKLSNKVQEEDIYICESVQQGMRSTKYTSGRYSVKREGGIYYFHELLKGIYGDLIWQRFPIM
jgi:choline monooxygenase